MSSPSQIRRFISKATLFSLGAFSVVYAVSVIVYVSHSYTIGIRSVLEPVVFGDPPEMESGFAHTDHLRQGDRIVMVGDVDIRIWSDLLQAPGQLQRRIEFGEVQPEGVQADNATGRTFVRVRFHHPNDQQIHETWCELQGYPIEEMVPSLIWLILKGSLFVIGGLVYWNRPDDEAALRFYILCVITLGAYMGGYHWAHVATQPLLMVIFMICAVLLPVASLHFYLVFPRKLGILESHPRWTLGLVYGLPLLNLACLLGLYGYIKGIAEADTPARGYMLGFIYAAFAIAMLCHLACMATLVYRLRTLEDSTELKQVRCISIGIFFSLFPVGVSLYIVLAEPDLFVEGAVTWPMFAASIIVTLAFVLAITRYRLMELDKMLTSGAGYLLISLLAGLMYYAVVFIGTLFYSGFVGGRTLPAAMTVSTTALLFVLALDAARSRIQRALDRRFSRSKSQLDETLAQMSQAVSQLVDPPVLAQRLLASVCDTLGVTRGAIYLQGAETDALLQAASRGETTFPRNLRMTDPLVEAIRAGVGLQAVAANQPRTAAQVQLHQLDGEIAQPLLSNGRLLAILILGSKESPFRAEDWTLLSAFGQITAVALESAENHRAIEGLNTDLQTKVDKIAEQQRRILALQSQLHRRSQPSTVKAETPPLPPTAWGDEDKAGAEQPQPQVAGVVGSSPVVRQLLTVVRKVAATDAVVLLRGESGTGKELFARAVHETSPRAGKPYVKVHCAALSANLLESELFGHVKGAFTGAHKDKIGRFELADGGTLFLDEIGDISLEVQTKLLRVLQEKTIERVGSSESLTVDVRIIAATHQNLESLIRQGRFREDLFYRLNVFPILVPPLRDRLEDIPELVQHFIARSALRCKKSVSQIDDDALLCLKSCRWPGNIRQLENVIERAVVIAEGDILSVRDLPDELFTAENEPQAPDRLTSAPAESTAAASLRNERDRFEREQILLALGTAGGNKSEAARILGIARSTLISRLRKLGIDA